MEDSSCDQRRTMIVTDYFKKRKRELAKFHPHIFGSCIDEATESAICIPPSWDLIRDSFKGAQSELKIEMIGDEAEAFFLKTMQSVQTPGILIGNIDYLQTVSKTYGTESSPPESIYEVVRAAFHSAVQQTPPRPGSKGKPENLEIDFVYIHPQAGLYLLEIKHATDNTLLQQSREAIADHGLKSSFMKNLFVKLHSFLATGEEAALTAAASIEELWKTFFRGKLLCIVSTDEQYQTRYLRQVYFAEPNAEKVELSPATTLPEMSEELKKIFVPVPNVDNFFHQYPICIKYATMLCGYRPDFYISPVQCALQVFAPLHQQFHTRINWYKNRSSFRTETESKRITRTEKKAENKAKKAKVNQIRGAKKLTVYLKELMRRKVIKDANIGWSEADNLWFTPDQIKAVEMFDRDRNLQRRQLIIGTPGSGKTLILQLKLFIVAQQMERTFPLYIGSSKEHLEQMQPFINDINNRDRSLFREVNSLPYFPWKENKSQLIEKDRVQEYKDIFKTADVLLDERRNEKWIFEDHFAKNYQHVPQVLAVVVLTDVNGIVDALHDSNVMNKLTMKCKSHRVCLSTLTTTFRSTRWIQTKFHSYNRHYGGMQITSGHCIDGVPTEFHACHSKEFLPNQIVRRIQKLVSIEQCKLDDIMIVFDDSTGRNQICDEVNGLLKQSPIRVHSMLAKQTVSLEKPVVIAITTKKIRYAHSAYQHLMCSRAMCHLIEFHCPFINLFLPK